MIFLQLRENYVTPMTVSLKNSRKENLIFLNTNSCNIDNQSKKFLQLFSIQIVSSLRSAKAKILDIFLPKGKG